MNAIVLLCQAGVPALLADDMDAARSFTTAEKSEATRRAYRSDFAIFVTWCRARGLEPVPAAVETVAAFLSAEAMRGTKASTIGRRAAAIRYAHASAGLEPPTSTEAVRAVLRGIRRTIGTAKVQKAPATADRLMAMLALAPDNMRGLRDRALLALGFAGAFRRSELVALTVADLQATDHGFLAMVRRSKTDQEGAGAQVAILHGHRICPVAAVRAWLEAAGIVEGPVFRAVTKSGKVHPDALTPESVANLVKSYAKLAGFDPSEFAGHSLRAGFITSAADAQQDALRIAEVSRHKSLDVLRTYVRRASLFRDHAGASFL